jgi:uncharacterized repeat protein (TIGR01451 family)
MINFLPNAGQGEKITAKFKSKVFSFGDVLVDHNRLTLFQISEPLQATSSATSADPAPYGTDINGKPLNDPIPDTQIDPSTGHLVSAPATGTPALLDKWTVTKPEITSSLSATLSAPEKVHAGDNLTYTIDLKNNSQYSLNGTQVRLQLPDDVSFAGTPGDNISLHGEEVVITVGRLATGAEQTVSIPTMVSSSSHGQIEGSASVYSSTALPLITNEVETTVIH